MVKSNEAVAYVETSSLLVHSQVTAAQSTSWRLQPTLVLIIADHTTATYTHITLYRRLSVGGQIELSAAKSGGKARLEVS